MKLTKKTFHLRSPRSRSRVGATKYERSTKQHEAARKSLVRVISCGFMDRSSYSACMMDDLLVEIDIQRLKVSRHFLLTRGSEMGMIGAPAASKKQVAGMDGMKHMDMGGHSMEPPKKGDVSCSPTWAQPSIGGSSIFVACNKSDEIVEVDAAKWNGEVIIGVHFVRLKPKGGCVHERTPPICLASHVHREGFLQLRTSRYDPSDHQLGLLRYGHCLIANQSE